MKSLVLERSEGIAARLTLVYVSLIITFLMSTSMGNAKIPSDAIVGIWLFDEGTGEVAKDASGNGHDGEMGGSVKWVDGKFDGALSFPGNPESCVVVPNRPSLVLTTWSITAWVKLEKSEGQWQVVLNKYGAPGSNYGLQTDDTNVLVVSFTHGARVWSELHAKTKVADGKWHHVAGTYDKKAVRAYLDGREDAKLAATDVPNDVDVDVTIGSGFLGSSDFAKGIIDDVGLFKVALSLDEINDIMKEGVGRVTGISAVSFVGKLATAWGKIKAEN